MSKHLILCASSREGKNMALSKKIHSVFIDLNEDVELVNLVDLNFPLFSTDERKEGLTEEIILLWEKMKKAQSFMAVSPEYNGSIPPVFTNAMAWMTQVGEDWREVFNNKFAFVATHSGGGGQKLLTAIRGQLQHLGVNVLAREILTNGSRPVNEDSLIEVSNELIKCTSI